MTAANSAFQQLSRVNIWSSRALTLFVKMQFPQCIVMSVLLCSGETWAVVKQHISPLGVFQMNCLRCICVISLRDHVPNVDILNRCNTLPMESQLRGKRLRWLGHVFRMPNDRLPKKLLFGQVKGVRPPGRLRSSFNDVAFCTYCLCATTPQHSPHHSDDLPVSFLVSQAWISKVHKLGFSKAMWFQCTFAYALQKGD